VKLVLTANEDAYVTVIDVAPRVKSLSCFPIRTSPTTTYTPIALLRSRPRFAGQGEGRGPVGAELIKVIASSRPILVVSETQLYGVGPFRTVDGGAQRVARDLHVTAEQAAQGATRLVLMNFTLRTVANRTNAPTLIIVPGTAATLQSAPVATMWPVVMSLAAPPDTGVDSGPAAVSAAAGDYPRKCSARICCIRTRFCDLRASSSSVSRRRHLAWSLLVPNIDSLLSWLAV
jgi:hypothetical protein